MTATLASMVDTAPMSSCTKPPTWFFESTKQQCAALPRPCWVTVDRAALFLAYHDGRWLERCMSTAQEGDAQSTYTLHGPRTQDIVFQLPAEAAELVQYIH